jgi:hypothetical protein
VDELGRKVTLGKHAEEGAFGVGVREYDAGSDFSAIFENNSTGATITGQDLRDGGGGANLDAELASGSGERLSDRSHATDDVAVETLEFMIAATQ